MGFGVTMEMNLWACLDISRHNIELKNLIIESQNPPFENSNSFERKAPKLKIPLEGYFAQKQIPRKLFPWGSTQGVIENVVWGGQTSSWEGSRIWQCHPWGNSFSDMKGAKLRASWSSLSGFQKATEVRHYMARVDNFKVASRMLEMHRLRECLLRKTAVME